MYRWFFLKSMNIMLIIVMEQFLLGAQLNSIAEFIK